jgi:hypothetical protein
MARIALATTLVLGGCAAPQLDRPQQVVTSPRITIELADLRAEVARLEQELIVANIDRAALAARVEALERSRSAPPSSPGPRAVALRPPDGCAGWAALVGRHDWPTGTACRILWCESRGDPDARNGRHVGLFQIADGPADPEANVALAHAMWARRGWQPWGASRRCWA